MVGAKRIAGKERQERARPERRGSVARLRRDTSVGVDANLELTHMVSIVPDNVGRARLAGSIYPVPDCAKQDEYPE